MGGADLLTIVECGDPILRRRADPVDPKDLATREVQQLLVQMRATMDAAPGSDWPLHRSGWAFGWRSWKMGRSVGVTFPRRIAW